MKSSLIIIITAIITVVYLLVFQQPIKPVDPVKPGNTGTAVIDSAAVDSVTIIAIADETDAIGSVSSEIIKPGKYSSRYDLYFKKYSDRLFGPWFDWRWFKAQGIAESNLDSTAKSSCHARGVMQILPSTHADIIKQNHWIENNIWSPRWNIAAGITYDRQMWNYWVDKIRPEEEHIKFMFGSYNGGYGNTLKAYLIVMNYKMPPTWYYVVLAGKRDVPTWRVIETENYVNRIFKVKSEL